MSILVREAPLDQIQSLRTAVLRPDFPEGKLASYDGDALAETFHVGAFDGDLNVGVATFHAAPYPHSDRRGIRLRGMAVHPDYQGKGIGADILEFAYSRFHDRFGHGFLWCNARLSALGFYQNLGFTTDGDEFDIPNIGPHYVMWKEIT